MSVLSDPDELLVYESVTDYRNTSIDPALLSSLLQLKRPRK